MLKLKLQYFGHLMWRTESLEKTLMLGKIEVIFSIKFCRRRRGWQRMRWCDDVTKSMDLNLSKFWELMDREDWHAAFHGVTKNWTWLSDWTETERKEGFLDFILKQLVGKWYLIKWSEVAQLCPTFHDPMDCSLPGNSIHGIFKARVLEWVAISFSRGSSWPRDQTQVSHIVSRCFTIWTTWEVNTDLLGSLGVYESFLCRG